MDIHKRLKAVRKALGLTQAEFGARVNLKQNTIAAIECGRSTSDQTIRVICDGFGISKEWIETGEGDMFAIPDTVPLDTLAEKYKMDEDEKEFVRHFVTAPPALRKAVVEFVKTFGRSFEITDTQEDTHEAEKHKTHAKPALITNLPPVDEAEALRQLRESETAFEQVAEKSSA